MSTNTVDAPARSAPSAVSSTRRGLRGFADRWPFQRKLNVLVGVPLTVIALLLAYLITDLIQESDRAEDAARLVRDSTQVAQLVADVQAEHQQAILLSVRHEASLDGGTPSTNAYRVAQLAVDAQIQKVRETFGDRLPDTEAQALREIEGLAGLRDTIEQGYLPADNIDPAYAGAADGLIDGLGLDRNSALATTFTGNLLDSLLRADAAHGAFETGVFSARTGDSNALIEFTGAVGSLELYTYQTERFARFATEEQADELGDIEHNSAQAVIGQHFAELAVDPSDLQAESKAEIRAAFRQALDSYHHYNEQAETRLKITGSLIGQIADRADEAASSAQWRATLLLSLALLGFAVWIAFAVLVRRSVIRPVLALTGAAQEVADVAGRELARVADDDAEESGPPRLRELPVTADDEIGELAEAFNNVQTRAAALLERQVLSRRNVAEMFGNVGRRVSNLTTRQLALIDAVERGETDPALLERLYSIDHIAVRLRRNADSLMLLAGIRETVLDAGPTALTNVVRAGLGQIEGYQRVRLHAGTEVMVEPDIIGDLTLMIAELLENAVSFSPEGSPVEVTVDSGAHGATITVADHGLGMSAERLAEENARLVRRERLDLVPTRVLGLFVVGALARRWDIDVTLSRTPGGGVTAEVTIPSTLLLTLSGVGAPAAAPTEPALAGAARSGATTDAPSTSGTLNGSSPDSAGALPAPSVRPALPTAGPSPAVSVPAEPADHQEPLPLPRRVPRRDPAPVTHTEHPPAHDRTTEPTPHGDTETEPGRTTDEATAHTRTEAPTGEDTAHARTGPDTSEPASSTRTGANAEDRTAHARTESAAEEPAAHTRGTDTPAHPDGDAQAHTGALAPHATSTDTPACPAEGATDTEPHTNRPTAPGHAEYRSEHPSPHPDGTPARPAKGTAAQAGVPAALARAEARAEGAASPGSEAPSTRADAPTRGAATGSRPLRRRVRGATLRTTVDAAAQQAARRTVRPADADAVRSALEEFEAAVERAHRDTGGGTGEHPRPTVPRTDEQNDRDDRHDQRRPPHHQNSLPEGAEQ
ncbi:ATP-binding protein [Streptomyces aurantiogriseus]|uniref:histidine kinase n=1 Tax=Streptomyces aurantiogriseus TaxID=66870 RepID=A0A918FPL9_9ACTN|nr:ATP-binding protein [Streptomyces aurantiogriseus]GGR64654.1 histidine kinase [Streptomyces aurantiogriseus]